MKLKEPQTVCIDVCVCLYIIICLYNYVCITEPFEETEEKWLSSLEGTRWLEYVRFVQPLPFFFLNFMFGNSDRFTGVTEIV